uniref:Uncharacterized protein n=1 Tax=Peronospora matthiolae TaxID=2874970 RepID=A0AAV1U2S9_9STRA
MAEPISAVTLRPEELLLRHELSDRWRCKLLREHVDPTFELRQIEAGHHADSINEHQQKHYHQAADAYVATSLACHVD